MSKQMIKPLGILLAVCFLMSVTAAAVSAAPCDNPKTPQKYAKGYKDGKLPSEGMISEGMISVYVKEHPVYIKNLIINIKNLVIAKKSTIFNDKVFLRVGALKKMKTKC